MLVSARGVLAIALSGLLVKIVGQHVFDNLPGRQVALPPCHLCRFLQPLWPLFSPLVENDQIRYQGDGQAIEVTSSNVFLLAFLLTYSSNSSGFAFSSRDISAYWASSPAIKIGNLVSTFSRFFQPHRQRSQIWGQPLTSSFPLSSWCQPADYLDFGSNQCCAWE